VFGVTVFAVAVAFLSLASPIAVESLVNTVAFGVLMWPVFVLAAILMGCLGLAAAIRAMQFYLVECIQRRLFVRVVSDYALRLPKVRLEAYDHQHGPELANRFFDVLNVQKSLAYLMLECITLFVTAIVGMVVLAFYHPFLFGFDILLIALIAFTLFVLGRGGIRTSLRESHAKYDAAAWIEELAREPRSFKFGAGAKHALEKADKLAAEYVKARRGHFHIVWRQTLFALGLQVVASTVLLGLGGYLVINRQLTLGQLVASELIVSLIVVSLSKMGKYAETFYDLMSGSEKLGLITDLPLERDGGEALLTSGRGIAIAVAGIDHASHRGLPTPANFTIAPNDRVALLGPAGSGKSTLLEVLSGLREPDRGVVTMDGIEVRGLNLEILREQVALVQGAGIFAGTVLENIRAGGAFTPEQVRDVLRFVGLEETVRRLPHSLSTELQPHGGPLSHSQAMRLGLARALIGKPRLLILDGVLDDLDPADAPDFLDRLFDPSQPWTLIVATNHPAIRARCNNTLGSAEHVGDHH
jgi:ABC-type bacteriocin/lantibiotic exporter with double-glycine peptidase domain